MAVSRVGVDCFMFCWVPSSLLSPGWQCPQFLVFTACVCRRLFSVQFLVLDYVCSSLFTVVDVFLFQIVYAYSCPVFDTRYYVCSCPVSGIRLCMFTTVQFPVQERVCLQLSIVFDTRPCMFTGVQVPDRVCLQFSTVFDTRPCMFTDVQLPDRVCLQFSTDFIPDRVCLQISNCRTVCVFSCPQFPVPDCVFYIYPVNGARLVCVYSCPRFSPIPLLSGLRIVLVMSHVTDFTRYLPSDRSHQSPLL